MLVNSIDPLAPYKVSDDLILELVNVNALIKLDPEMCISRCLKDVIAWSEFPRPFSPLFS
jgi:hypothetical protein